LAFPARIVAAISFPISFDIGAKPKLIDKIRRKNDLMYVFSAQLPSQLGLFKRALANIRGFLIWEFKRAVYSNEETVRN